MSGDDNIPTDIPGASPQTAQVATSLTASPVLPERPAHDPYRRTTDLLQRLAPGKMRVGFFIGAGCPLAIRVENGDKIEPLIPEIAGLTLEVKKSLDASIELKDIAATTWSRVIGRGIAVPTIEDVLSHIRTLKSLAGADGIDGFSGELLGRLDLAICEHVREIVKKPLPTSDTPYHVLASWIQAIAREKPVEIFTTNYDLLLEQALARLIHAGPESGLTGVA